MGLKKAPASKATASASISHSDLARRFPKCGKTGSALMDEDNEAKREMAMTVIDALVDDLDNAVPLHSALLKRQRLLDEAPSDTAMFKNATGPKQLDEDWVIHWLSTHSDLSTKEIVSSKAKDSESAYQLFMYALSFGPGLRFPSELQYRETAVNFFNARYEAAGKRLDKFKKNGGLSQTGRLNWVKGAYCLTFAPNGKLASIAHANGDKIAFDLAGDNPLNSKFALEQNWLDFGSYMYRDGFPRFHLHEYFKASKTGPYKIVYYTGKSKQLASDVATVHEQVERKNEATAAAQQADEDVQELLNEHAADRKRKSLASARAKASESVQDTKKARSVLFDDEPAA